MLDEEYATLEEIPAAYRHLFVKSGDKYVLVAAADIRSKSDVEKLQESLRKERKDHSETKDKLRQFGDEEPEVVLARLDRIKELELAAGGKLDEDKLSEMVEARLQSKLGPVQRELNDAKKKLADTEAQVAEYEKREVTRKIHDHVREAGLASKVHQTALDDILLQAERVFEVSEDGRVVTRDNVGVTPGIGADVWLTDMQQTRPHWWPVSQGANARPGGGSAVVNPFSAKHWNLTEQGKLVTADHAKAEQMAAAAGTTIGGPKPAE